MDASTFDTLTKTLIRAGSRRRALGGLLASTLGLIGWQDPEEAIAHDLAKKCKKKSGEAKKKCLKKAKKHAATHLIPPPPVGGGGGGTSPVNPCDGRIDGFPCGEGKECSGQICGTRPDCSPKGTFRPVVDPSFCCSRRCEFNVDCRCDASDPGAACLQDSDCLAPSTCRGFRCECLAPAKICPSGRCGTCCADGECTGGKRCFQDGNGVYRCACDAFQIDCGGTCISSQCGQQACGTECTNNPNICCPPLTCQQDSQVTRACLP